MGKNSFILKGDICWSASPQTLAKHSNAFLLCLNGKSGGVFKEIPEKYNHLPLLDYTAKLIIPGLTDLHTHAPQFSFRALGMDMELLDWLNTMTFPEESKYGNLEYARRSYSYFIEEIKKGPNTRFCIFSTIHVPGTLLLMDMMEESGLVSFVGKVNMDRNCPDYLRENDSAGLTLEWLDSFYTRQKEGRYKNTAPIITPRFIPVCSDKLLKRLAEIQKEHKLPLQSHLSENRREVEWVKELCPESESYTDAYRKAGLLEGPAIMAHCVWLDEREMDTLAEKGTYIAHCPQSNTNLSSGIAPARRFFEKGIPMGLGSDVAGGAHSSIFRIMNDAIQVSKLRQIYGMEFSNSKTRFPEHDKEKSQVITLEEAFYLATAGGGSFFGKIAGTDFGPSGSFEEGWDFDAIVIDDSSFSSTGWNNSKTPDLRDRLERVVYLSDDRHIIGKYVRGIAI